MDLRSVKQGVEGRPVGLVRTLPAHRLAGVRKLDAHYSSRRTPPRARTRMIHVELKGWCSLDGRGGTNHRRRTERRAGKLGRKIEFLDTCSARPSRQTPP